MKIHPDLRRGIRFLAAFSLMGCLLLPATAQRQRTPNPLRRTAAAFFQTDTARLIGEQVLLFQRVTGGWPKNIDMARRLTDEERARVEADRSRRDDSTIDNNATTTQMDFLARLYRQTGDTRCRDAFRRGVGYLLAGQ